MKAFEKILNYANETLDIFLEITELKKCCKECEYCRIHEFCSKEIDFANGGQCRDCDEMILRYLKSEID